MKVCRPALLYAYISLSKDNKRTDYFGKQIADLIDRRWAENFSNETENSITNNVPENYSEDALTRHLLKLSDIEKTELILRIKFLFHWS